MFVTLCISTLIRLVTLIQMTADADKMEKIILTEQYLNQAYKNAMVSIQNLESLVLIFIIMIVFLIIMFIYLSTTQIVAKAEIEALKKQI